MATPTPAHCLDSYRLGMPTRSQCRAGQFPGSLQPLEIVRAVPAADRVLVVTPVRISPALDEKPAGLAAPGQQG